MKLFIKNMVNDRCIMIVKSELRMRNLHFMIVDTGEVQIMETLTPEQMRQFGLSLKLSGMELLDNATSILVEKIKNAVVDLIHFSNEQQMKNFSIYLSEKLKCDYTYLDTIFAESQGTSIEQYFLSNIVERVKEMLIYDELEMTEIADKIYHTSIVSLSFQFKRATGLTPNQYKHLVHQRSATW